MIAGLANAPVTIEEFADFECKYCVRGSNTTREVLKNYAGKVNLVFRNMPLPAHQNALIAAKAFSAVCLQSPSLAYSYQKHCRPA
jgi:protein-disulfide isomerase